MKAPSITSSESKLDSNLIPVIATLIVPAIAITFALVHINQVKTDRVSPWKGGSFGMFSTLSQSYHRQLYISVNVDGNWIPVRTKEKWFLDAKEIITARPTDAKLEQLGNDLAGFYWHETSSAPKAIQLVVDPKPGVPLAAVSAIRIAVWQAHFDSKSKRFTMKPLAAVEKKTAQ